mgnify:FL=1
MEYNEIKSLLNEPETVAEGLAQLDIFVSALEQTNTDLTKSVEKYKDTNANLAMLVSKPQPEPAEEDTEENERKEKFRQFVETL